VKPRNKHTKAGGQRGTISLGLIASAAMAVLAAPAVQARPVGTVVADVVAIDQSIVYNRFGSFNPYGMIYALKSDVIDLKTGKTLDQPGVTATPCMVTLKADKRPRPLVLRANQGDKLEVNFTNLLCDSAPGTPGNDPFAEAFAEPAIEPVEAEIGQVVERPPNGFSRPATRLASMVFQGLTHDSSFPGYNTWDPRVTGISGIAPGESITYRLLAEREGNYLVHDNGAPAGGEGDGGSTVLGLYGTLNVEPAGANVYRSQVRNEIWKVAKAQAPRGALINYEAVDLTGQFGSAGLPLLNMHKDLGGGRYQLVHADINAIVQDYVPVSDGYSASNENWFREFTLVFQDELKTVQAYADVIDATGAGAGIRDGFAINYGASGAGTIVAANRLGVGPAANCAECALEEFFLTSWANGDPAMILKRDADGHAQQLYPDDPGNVHHNYIGDPVRFRTVQAGVKESHVFHLHANQWFGGEGDKSTYLDSQTISPKTAMTYSIAYTGSNRNLSVGDAIFHCHMYPHFAQGMWGLWRNHDVLEDGSRRLPDGELGPGTNPLTGVTAGGAFTPGIIPIRNNALAPTPTYGATATPGFPFFMPGSAGHRPPQPPLDLAEDSKLGPTGVGRHIMVGGDRVIGAGVAAGDLSSNITRAEMVVLPHEGTPLERAAMAFHSKRSVASRTSSGALKNFSLNGKAPTAGAPFADPCPATAPERRYDVSIIELDMVVNKAGWHDPQARINVLSSDVAQYEGQKRTADPFFFRANSGDCVMFYHTNRTPHELQKDDFQIRTPTDTIGQHIHLVKFDVMASDGGNNGWNYEDGTFARGALVERVEGAHKHGTVKVVNPDGSTVVKPSHDVLPEAANLGYQTTIQRWWADELFDMKGKDRTLRTVFTHDHFAASSIQQHGFYNALVVEPKGSEWLKPNGDPLTSGVGTEAIIQNAADPLYSPDFREFMLASADFSTLYTQDGKPVDPPAKPEAVSAHHHNPYLINNRNEPLPLRFAANGEKGAVYTDKRGDPAFAFSSAVHGDPFTPVLNAYEGERVQIRMIHGAQEVQQVFTLHGHRWKREIANPDSPYVGAQELGISEHFEVDTGRIAQVTGGAKSSDFLFHYGTTDALWNGAWGLLRTHDAPESIDPATQLPVSNRLRPMRNFGRATAGLRARVSRDPRTAGCPAGSPPYTFNVEVWAARDLLPGGRLVYNERAGITDPSALMYVHAADVPAYRAGTKKPEPFVMRANAGDCIVVNLTNKLPADQPVPDLPGDALMPMATSLNADDIKPSKYVGMHAQLLHYDVRTSDGSNVGNNPEQLAGPGQTKTYVWYAGKLAWETPGGAVQIGKPIEYGSIPLRAMGDVVKHGAQGLIGSLIIENKYATYWDATGTQKISPFVNNTTATIKVGDQQFKEFVLMYQDGLNLRVDTPSGKEQQIVQHFVGDDSYDFGERALNYRTEPLWSRIDYTAQPSGSNCTQALVISGDINPCLLGANLMVDNDPDLPGDLRGLPVETPVFEAKAGEDVKFRVLQPDGRARMHSFRVLGHNYPDMGIEGFITPGNSFIVPGKGLTASLYGGAKKGYWHYRDGPNMFVNTGVWGLFKVR
jgi:hypothetical protein